ncbi:MAG: hypothetical protein ACRBBN_10575, partial [Methyloligellaceae bacterium]
MSDVDEAFEKAEAIHKDIISFGEKINTEEDTKIQIINRVLCECLGWLPSDISAETHHENGYSDYILSNSSVPALLIEAKRMGAVDVTITEKSKIKHLKISGPGLKAAQAGINQATSYAAPNGLNIAVLTDGTAWIIYKTFIPGVNYKTKAAIVFPSFEAILEDFSSFYDLLSKMINPQFL